MTLTRLSGDSGVGGSPAVYQRDPRTLVVLGDEVHDPTIPLHPGEAAVAISSLLAFDAVCQIGGPMTMGDLYRMFRMFGESTFRLETLPVYREPSEIPRIAHFEATGEIRADEPAIAAWMGMLAGHAAAGRSMRRVHLVRLPLTGYLRFEFAFQQHSVAAGEDVRVVDLGEHPDLAALDTDFWLFDNRVPILMRYEADGALIGPERAPNDELERLRGWRDLTWAAAVPLTEFLTRAGAA
ncbi:MAG: DUF6879 family protein [Egibacteraceae bacterium]